MRKIIIAIILMVCVTFNAFAEVPINAEDAFLDTPEEVVEIEEIAPAEIEEVVEIKDQNDKIYNPNLKNISNSWMKYVDEFELTDRNLLDSYLAVNYCEETEHLFSDDIAREAYRNSLRKDIIANQDTFPHKYRLVKPIKMKRYDFDNEKILIERKSVLKSVNTINIPIDIRRKECNYPTTKEFDKDYLVDLRGTISISEVPLELEKAKEVIPKIHYGDKRERIFYLIIDVELLGIAQQNKSQVKFKGKLLDIGFYTAPGEENRFADYAGFDKYEEIEEIDYLEDLQFIGNQEAITE